MDTIGLVEEYKSTLEILNWTRYCSISAVIILTYDYFITIDQELEFIWYSDWSVGKILFLTSRYVTIAEAIYYAVSVRYSIPLASGTDANVLMTIPTFTFSCLSFLRVMPYLGIISYSVSELILQIRLRAMYNQDRTICILMWSTFAITRLWLIIQSGFFAAALEVTSTPLSGLSKHFCVQLNDWRYYYLYWAPLLFFESLLFILALYKGYQCYRTADPSTAHLNRTINFLVRDSVWYFLTIFSVYLANAIVSNIQHQKLRVLPGGFSVALSSVMAQRLILNVRSELGNKQQYGVDMETVLGSPKMPLIDYMEPSTPKRASVYSTRARANYSAQASGVVVQSSSSETQWLMGTEDIMTGVMMQNLNTITRETMQNVRFPV